MKKWSAFLCFLVICIFCTNISEIKANTSSQYVSYNTEDEEQDPPDCASRDVVLLLSKKMTEGELPRGQLFDMFESRTHTMYAATCSAKIILENGLEASVIFNAFLHDGAYSIDSVSYEFISNAYELPLLTSPESFIGYVNAFHDGGMQFAELVMEKEHYKLFIGSFAPYAYSEATFACLEDSVHDNKLVKITGTPTLMSDGSKGLNIEKEVTCTNINDSKAVALGYFEDILLFHGIEKDVKKCGQHLSFEQYLCLNFSKLNGEGDALLMAPFGGNRSSLPSNGSTVLVRYERTSKNSYTSYAFSVIPKKVKSKKLEGVFLGLDDMEEFYMFQDAKGEKHYLGCIADFCSQMLEYKGRKMQVEYNDMFSYHEGGQAYGEDGFIFKYKLK